MVKKLQDYTLKGKTLLSIFLVIALILGLIYLGLLIKPDWEILINLPILHQAIAYGVITLIILGLGFIIYLIVDTIIDKNELEKTNKVLEDKIEGMEEELKRLKAR